MWVIFRQNCINSRHFSIIHARTYVNGPRRYDNIRYALAKFSATHRLFEFCKRHSLPLAAVEQLRKDATSLYWVLANNKKKKCYVVTNV